MSPEAIAEETGQLRRMRGASLVEGTTLLVLLGIAVPLKHLADMPIGVRLMGPVHGVAFVFYFHTLFQTISGGGWSRRESVRLILAAFVPLGTFFNERLLRRHQRVSDASA